MSAISPSEADWWRAQTVSLNKTVSDVVSNYTFAKFAPVDFSGHEFCTNTPWIQDLSATAPFHPTIEGQSAIAQAVTGAYSPYAH
jgi:lysophospholipase L1-like esterase